MRRVSLPVTVLLLILASMVLSPPAQADPETTATAPAGLGLRGTMVGGNTIGADVREKHPRPDGYRHVDTPMLIRRLQSMHMNFYVFGIWDSPTDWADLRDEFAPAAQDAGIMVMPYLVPPSECAYFGPDGQPLPRLVDRGKCSAPYYLDYVGWAQAIAELSLRYPTIIGWAIDDFSVSSNAAKFTPEYMQQVKAAQDAVNPRIGLWTTVYPSASTNDAFLTKYAPYIEGMIFVYNGRQDAARGTQLLDAALAHTNPLGIRVIFLMYAGRYLQAWNTPMPAYMTQLTSMIRPYVENGGIDGILSYATPLAGLPESQDTYWARSGSGRLSLSVAGAAGTQAGNFASANQTVAVTPGLDAYSITFYESDQWPQIPGLITGYHKKQLLLDGQVIWDSDVADGKQDEFVAHTIDVTEAVRGKPAVDVTFRLFEARGVGDYAVDVSFDDVSAQGLDIRDGGFEESAAWVLNQAGVTVLPLLDRWSAYRAVEVADAVGRVFASMAGEPEHPAHPEHPTNAPKNPRAMYGAGRLSLSVPQGTPTTAGQCASASQRVQVTPGQPRYELSFWHRDQYWNTPAFRDFHSKQVLIDGEPVFTVDVTDRYGHKWLQGRTLQGPIDVTEVVSGKQSVDLTFRLCETRNVTNLPVDVGIDHIESTGLQVQNPDFEEPTGWQLSSNGDVRASLDIARAQ